MRVLLAALLWCLSAHGVAEWHSRSAAIMGTEIRVELWTEFDAKADELLDESMAIFQSIDNRFSPYKSASELSQLNAQAFENDYPVSDDLGFLLEKSLHYSALTQGAFDITFASVGYLYNYRDQKSPSDNRVNALKSAINYQALSFKSDQQTLRFGHPDCRLDLGGIAKGFAVDEVVAYLSSAGVEHAAVSAGGDTQFIGDKKGRPWMVGVQHPRQAEKLSVVLPMSDFAMSTSGDYERFYIDENTGERIHHIINPTTGKPSKALGSVTVIGPKSIDTDALSTSIFILGVEKGLALLDGLSDFDGIIVESNGKIHHSRGLQPPAPTDRDHER